MGAMPTGPRALLKGIARARLPYDPFRRRLYTADELLAPVPGKPAQTRDDAIFAHYARSGGHHPGLAESLTRRVHDFSVDAALARTIGRSTAARLDLVGVMGGHGASRRSVFFHKAARIGYRLIREGFRVASGGGPGIMEAANLGAYMAAAFSERDLETALLILGDAPDMPKGEDWQRDPEKLSQYRAYMAAPRRIVQKDFVRRRPRRPKDFTNLALPTWFYGWEPSNLFADGIAKYFSNSLREDGLLAISAGGVVYAPGSLGTTQELFMDAAQNHYVSFGYTSPMALLGVEHYATSTSHYRLLRELSANKPWGEMLTISDEPEEIVAFLKSKRPRGRPKRSG